MKRDPKTLKVHPLLKDSPMMHPAHPDCLCIRDSLQRDEFNQPVLINERDEIMDGRHRVREAIAIGMSAVPVEVRPDAEASAIITRSLTSRRHLAKWQLAYCLADVFEDEAKANTAARVARHLRRGTQTPDPHEPQLAAYASSLRDCGISSDTWQRAQRVRKALLARPDLRAKFEPRMFAHGPDALSLDAVARAIPSVERYEGPNAPDLRDKRKQYSVFLKDWFGKATFHLTKRWEAMGAKQRAAVVVVAVDAALQWPPEIKTAMRDALDEDLHP